jgi:hypothetical protein
MDLKWMKKNKKKYSYPENNIDLMDEYSNENIN